MPADLEAELGNFEFDYGTVPEAAERSGSLPNIPIDNAKVDYVYAPIEHLSNGMKARSNLGPYTMNQKIEQPKNEQSGPIKGIIIE